jgi:hypothetical protein
VAPWGSCDRTRASVASDIKIWPPWAAAISRAQRLRGRLTYWPSRSTAWPWRSTASSVCRPIRTFNTPVSAGHDAASRARWASSAALTAPTAEENATAIPSPIVENTAPPWCPNASWSVSLCRTRDRAMAAGSVSHSRVEPSMSVKAKVTVPSGSSASPGSPGEVGDRRGGAAVPSAALRKLSLRTTARSSASSRSSSLGVAKVRYDVVPAARMLSINVVRRGSWSGAGRFRYNSIGLPAARRYSSSRPEMSIPGATQPYRCQ